MPNKEDPMTTTNPKKPRILLPNDYKAIEQREAFARKAFRLNIPYKDNDCSTMQQARNAVKDALFVMGLGSEIDSDDAFLFLTEEIIGKRYKKKAITCHPDKGGNELDFQALVTASNFLKSLLPQLKKQ